MEDAELRRYQRQVADPLRHCLHQPLPRPVHHIHFAVQHVHEDRIHRRVPRHGLLDVRQVQSHVRSQSRYVQDRVPGFTRARTGFADQSRALLRRGPMDIQHLSRISGDITAIVSGVEDRRGGEHHQSLPVRVGILQRLVPIQLGLPLLRRGSLRFNRHSRRIGADSSLL